MTGLPEGHLSLEVGEVAEVSVALEEPGHVARVEVAHKQRQQAHSSHPRPAQAGVVAFSKNGWRHEFLRLLFPSGRQTPQVYIKTYLLTTTTY